jgi:hypothetical protein
MNRFWNPVADRGPILTGTHEAGSSHYELLRAFADDATLRRVTRELDSCGYRTHEFGDSVLIERMAMTPTGLTIRWEQRAYGGDQSVQQQSLLLRDVHHAVCPIGASVASLASRS